MRETSPASGVSPGPSALPPPAMPDGRRNARVALMAAGGFFFMFGLSFAAVPLYDMFCRLTGYGGTPMLASQAPAAISDRIFAIRLDANVAPGLGWRFEPEVETLRLRAGEVRTVSYRLVNRRDVATTGIASYNVSPDQAGAWFNKIACFCFTEITLKPGEARTEEVTFFIDPEIAREKTLDALATITLSYTFFPARSGAKPLAAAGSLTAPQ